MEIDVYTGCSLLVTALIIPEEGMVGVACSPDPPTKDSDFPLP
jgi:hypothetical protein